ncbi:MAG TPA: phenylalanine--tRNA ligase subunit beta [Gammaproteobacteria bacterium]|nr:phenylalanine--tRNA ligase subunit beta [Gammaproteobacteria bacterium]
MKLNESWLREWVDPPIDIDKLAEQLTMSGLEVEDVQKTFTVPEAIVAAEIQAVEPHPEADRLKICRVNDGGNKPLTIVCGADGVEPGMVVPLARPGVVLPGDIRIEVSEFKGIRSEGMLCSSAELGLTEDADSLLELPSDTPAGQSLVELLPASDHVIEFSLTPNRGDCLSIGGIAREVAAINGCPLEPVYTVAVPPEHNNVRKVSIDAPAACACYSGRNIEGVDISRPAPLWLIARLNRCGIRSINPIVDITNYVMLEMGQPMHGFDNDLLQGAIHVRYAAGGEKLVLLDGQECDLSTETLVIADDSRPLALAGIMGGLDTAVTGTTRNVFLESAWFEPKTIIGEARSYGIHTDSAHRFERGVDYTLQTGAIERATRLILDACGGSAGPVSEVVHEKYLPGRKTVTLRTGQIERVLGITIDSAEVSRILTALGCHVDETGQGWEVTPPTYRFDLAIEADLIEELARMQGYDTIPVEVPRTGMRFHRDQMLDKDRILRDLLVHRGYYEAITYSFIDQSLQDLFVSASESLVLANPLSAGMSVMRGSLWPGLVSALQYNLKRQQTRARLFEIGRVFARFGKEIRQEYMIGGVIYGNIQSKQWDSNNKESDFFTLKGDVEAILRTAGQLDDAVAYVPAEHPALHPGQSAKITYKDQSLGWLGKLHPAIQANLDIAGPCYMFELPLADISRHLTPKYRKLSKFPVVRRDLALVVPEEVPLSSITRCINSAAPEALYNLELFDVYQGEGIDLGKKSLALGLTFQRSSSTLTDEEVEAIVGDMLVRLKRACGVTLRE